MKKPWLHICFFSPHGAPTYYIQYIIHCILYIIDCMLCEDDMGSSLPHGWGSGTKNFWRDPKLGFENQVLHAWRPGG